MNPLPDGLLLIDKPPGRTSHDVVALVRRALGSRSHRVGHAGTLDPLATGLLLVGLGSATRLQQFLTGLGKSYEGTLRLGTATTTWDADGEPGPPSGDPESVSAAALSAAAAAATGDTDQLAPPYSAKKVAGKKLYELARAGEATPEVRKRVTVTRYELGARSGTDVPFRIDGSSGTFVRTLVHELGLAVGVGAHVAALRRIAVGPIEIAGALPLETFLALPPDLRFEGPHFLPPAGIPLPFETLDLDADAVRSISRGQSVLLRTGGAPAGSRLGLRAPDGSLVGIGEVESAGEWSSVAPRIVLVTDGGASPAA